MLFCVTGLTVPVWIAAHRTTPSSVRRRSATERGAFRRRTEAYVFRARRRRNRNLTADRLYSCMGVRPRSDESAGRIAGEKGVVGTSRRARVRKRKQSVLPTPVTYSEMASISAERRSLIQNTMCSTCTMIAPARWYIVAPSGGAATVLRRNAPAVGAVAITPRSRPALPARRTRERLR